MKTILFQGDSITDAKRSREDEEYGGSGSAPMIKGTLGKEYPNNSAFLTVVSAETVLSTSASG